MNTRMWRVSAAGLTVIVGSALGAPAALAQDAIQEALAATADGTVKITNAAGSVRARSERP